MPRDLEFAGTDPAMAAARLDATSIHLWRIPHARQQGRAPLRNLLSGYLGVAADRVELFDDAHGKPAVAPELARHRGGLPLQFNWSHSGDYALVAIALGAAVGVDVQRHAPAPRALAIAERFFDPLEAVALASYSHAERDQAFLGLWCAKEAVLKAAGEGLSFGLSRLVFSRQESTWSLAHVDPALGSPSEWQLIGFRAAPGYHGALAWRGGARGIVPLRPDAN